MDHVKAVLSAAEQGNQQAISSFLEDGTADVYDEEGSTPLMYAAANGKETVIRLLLREEHATPNAQNAYGWTALMQAACYGHLGSVLLLLQGGAEVNAKNCWGTTALVGAAQGGFSTIVQHLLTHGAAVNHIGGALTPLMAAAQCGHMLILDCEALVLAGAELDARDNIHGWTALMQATHQRRQAIVELLCKRGADAAIKGKNGTTAMDIAEKIGDAQMIQLISEAKRDPEHGGQSSSSSSSSSSNKRMLLDLKGLHMPSGGGPKVPTLVGSTRTPAGGERLRTPAGGESPRTPTGGESPRTPVGGESPRTPEGGESPRTPEGGESPRTPVGGEIPRTPAVDAVRMPMMAGSPLTPPLNAPRIPLGGVAQTPTAPRTPLVGASRMPLFGAALTPVVPTPQAQRGAAVSNVSNALDPSILAAHLQNAFKTPDASVFPDASPLQSPETDCLQPRFPVYSAPTSLASSLEEQQLATSTPLVKGTDKKGPASVPRQMPPRVQGGGALGKLLAGGALFPAPKSVPGKNNARLGQGLGRASGSSTKHELPSLQKCSPLRVPLHVPRQQQQPLNKAVVVAPKAAGVVPRALVPAYGRGLGRTTESADSSRDHNPDLCAILAKHSLEDHFKLFSEQEVDYQSFLSLSAGDLRELGVCDEEEQLKLLELIELLNTEGVEAVNPTNGEPVFVLQ
eukprot:Em0018g341a